MKNKVVIAVAGMPGSGKATVVEVARKLGYGVIVMGGVVRAETQRRDLESTPENVGRVMLRLREEGGPAVVAKRCLPKIQKMKEEVIVVDGVRSLYEVDELKKHFSKFKLLAVHSPPETRFKRLFKRKRSDDPASWEKFLERDWRELHVGLGSAIASADIMIVNDGTRASFKLKVKNLLSAVEKSERSKRTYRSRS